MVWYKGMFLTVILLGSLYIDMYQDRTDRNKTVILVEHDGVIDTLTVNNTDLNKESTLKKIEELTHGPAGE